MQSAQLCSCVCLYAKVPEAIISNTDYLLWISMNESCSLPMHCGGLMGSSWHNSTKFINDLLSKILTTQYHYWFCICHHQFIWSHWHHVDLTAHSISSTIFFYVQSVRNWSNIVRDRALHWAHNNHKYCHNGVKRGHIRRFCCTYIIRVKAFLRCYLYFKTILHCCVHKTDYKIIFQHKNDRVRCKQIKLHEWWEIFSNNNQKQDKKMYALQMHTNTRLLAELFVYFFSFFHLNVFGHKHSIMHLRCFLSNFLHLHKIDSNRSEYIVIEHAFNNFAYAHTMHMALVNKENIEMNDWSYTDFPCQ